MNRSFPRYPLLLGLALLVSACSSLGPTRLEETRLQYNESLKRTAEEQLLLNIIRLRYTETPSSLAVSAIAAQFERSQSGGIFPFFTAAGGENNRSFTTVLPQIQAQVADRPTFSLSPQDDQEFTRKLFTPLPLDGLIYLAKTTWPISTVFRLYLENLNWVSNAQTASGPTPRTPPEVFPFLQGVEALQALQDRGLVVFGNEDKDEALAPPLAARQVSAADRLEAAKNGFRYKASPGEQLTLVRKISSPVLRIAPQARHSPEWATFTRAFNLRPDLDHFDITQESLQPFSDASTRPLKQLDLETRSLLQALYYVSHGVDIPEAHAQGGIVAMTREANGQAFDWQRVMGKFFRIHHRHQEARPDNAQVAVRYRDHWYYLDDRDQDSKAVFSLLLELGRLELNGKGGPGPQLTLPLSGR